LPATNDSQKLQLGDDVQIDTAVEETPLILRGKLSSLMPKVVWVKMAGESIPPLALQLKEGHPVRLSAAREGSALVGDATFRSILGTTSRLVAINRPAELKLVDRRAELRVTMRKSIGIRLARNSAAGQGGHFSIGTTIDIGMVGIRFETSLQMAVGDHIFVTVVLEQNRQLYVLAQIVRLDDAVGSGAADLDPSPSGAGRRSVRASAKWDAMAPADRTRLENFLLSAARAGLA
jgi:hypothetical protein